MFDFFILIFCLLFGFLAWRRLPWAVYLICASLPAFLIRLEIFKIPFTVLELMILILFPVFLIKNFKFRELKENPFFRPVLLFLFFATISLIVSPNLRGAAGIWKAYFLEPILFFFVFTSVLKKENLKNVLWALGISALYLSLIAVFQKLFPSFPLAYVSKAFLRPDGAVDRVVSILNYPNALGLYLGPVIVLFTGFLWQKGRLIPRILKALVIILGFSVLILAQSEAASLSVIIVWLLLILYLKKTRLFGIGLIVLVILILSFSPALRSFVFEKAFLQDYSGMIRRLIWSESSQMLKDHWFLGAGLAGYQTAIQPYHLPTFEIYLYPHNIILNFWSELGILGLFSFLLLIVYFFKLLTLGWKKDILTLTLILAMTQILIHGLVDAPYFKNDLSVLFWIIMGLAVVWRDGRAVEGATLEKS